MLPRQPASAARLRDRIYGKAQIDDNQRIKTNMKILQCSDLHGNLPWFEWIAREAPNYDLVCISGDLLDARSPETTHLQIEGISRILGAVRTPLALCSGNHDLVMSGNNVNARWMRALKRRGVWLDGERFEVQGRRFHCHGWDETVTVPQHPGEIWIVHSPPAGTATALEHGCLDAGDFEFGMICRGERGPRLALSGHAHNPRSWFGCSGRTFVLNPGQQQSGPEPTFIVVDLEALTAVRYSPAKVPELVKLPGPDAREVMAGKTRFHIEAQLRAAVSNMETEGYRFTPEEIDEIRRRLWRIADGK